MPVILPPITPPTPSTNTSYATPAQFLERFDHRTVGDLVNDEGSRAPLNTLADNPRLLSVLADASGAIEAALLVGGRYTVANLGELTGNSLAHLVRICCDIALVYLFDRRPLYAIEKRKAAMEIAQQHLKELQAGTEVFNLPAIAAASVPDLFGPSLVEANEWNLTRDRTRSYYPARRVPFGR